ncbi:hypothetical protein NEDG_00199 [Nematocida displodere]|uniref:Guanylate cyclase domain-containing protein n=1 Tax=Nematocida displodere TaxID=1805483 RepID=A0A177EIC2_9MICR|nr:hypothetical protein NEDG_00199 [Nematocida displodere]
MATRKNSRFSIKRGRESAEGPGAAGEKEICLAFAPAGQERGAAARRTLASHILSFTKRDDEMVYIASAIDGLKRKLQAPSNAAEETDSGKSASFSKDKLLKKSSFLGCLFDQEIKNLIQTERKKKNKEGAMKIISSKAKSTFITERLSIQRLQTSYSPSTQISNLILGKGFTDVEVPEQERVLVLEAFGQPLDMKITCHTTASDILHSVWQDSCVTTGIEECELLLVFHTFNSYRALPLESRPMIEILQWKLDNSLLTVMDKKIIPQNKLLKNWGYELRVLRKDQALPVLDHCCEKLEIDQPLVYTKAPLAKQAKQVGSRVYKIWNRFLGEFKEFLDFPSFFSVVFQAIVLFFGQSTAAAPFSPHSQAHPEKRATTSYQPRVKPCIKKDSLQFPIHLQALPRPRGTESVDTKVKRILEEVRGEGAVDTAPQESGWGRALSVPEYIDPYPKSCLELGQCPSQPAPVSRVSLNLSNMGLTEIPSVVFGITNISELDISNNRLTNLPKELNALKLTTLDASNNCITSIDTDLCIPFLRLANNHLTRFGSKYRYQEVNLLGNPLEEFRARTKILYIREMHTARKMSTSLNLLQRVSIVDVELKKFVGKFPFLEHLQLINNTLQEISIVAPRLQSVLCAHNLLTDFPFLKQEQSSEKFSRLVSLSLPYNVLNIIPNNAWKLPLEYLNVSRNQIVRIDPPGQQLTLRHLNVSGNQIKEVQNIRRLPSLVCFIASFNILERIADLDLLTELKMVDLSYNVFTAIPPMYMLPGRASSQPAKFPMYLSFLGNRSAPPKEAEREKLLTRGVMLISQETKDAFVKIHGIVGAKNLCKLCHAYVPKERAKEQTETKEIRNTAKAFCIKRTHVASLYPNLPDVPISVKIYVYFWSKSLGVHEEIEHTIKKLEQLLSGETEESLKSRWPKHKQRIVNMFTDLRHHVFPTKIPILCLVMVTSRSVCTLGVDPLKIVLFRNERGVFLKSEQHMEMAWAETKKTDVFVVVGHGSLFQTVSTDELVMAYKKNYSLSETQSFLFSHEFHEMTAMIIPLTQKPETVLRKKQKQISAPKILEGFSVYNFASQFMKAPAVVFTDIVNSTRLWALDPIKMREVSKMHNNTVRELIRQLGGYEVKTEGDAFMLIFYDDLCATRFGYEIHRRLLHKNWLEMAIEHNPLIYSKGAPIYRGIQIRVGISKGACVIENDPITKRLDFYGKAVIEAARLCNLANGGETLISQALYNKVKDAKKETCYIIPRGRALLSGLESETHHIYEILHHKLVKRLLLKSSLGVKKNVWLISKAQ